LKVVQAELIGKRGGRSMNRSCLAGEREVFQKSEKRRHLKKGDGKGDGSRETRGDERLRRMWTRAESSLI